METDLVVSRVLLQIEKGDEMQKYVEALSDINMLRNKSGLGAMWACTKEERWDQHTGLTYTLLAVYKIGMDKSDPIKAVKFQEVVPVDKDGNILQESKYIVKQASIVLESERIASFQQKRGAHLKAEAMNSHAGKFEFDLKHKEGLE
jgi:hypothetical protein